MFDNIVLILLVFKVIGSLSTCTGWPGDWELECGHPACPSSCDMIICGEDLVTSDCPEGSHLVDAKLFGCCPACVEYRDYMEACPGFGLTVVIEEVGVGSVESIVFTATNITYEEEESGDQESYPTKFISKTVDLPCSQLSITDVYTMTSVSLQERVYGVEWRLSSDGSKTVPWIESSECRPDLTCQVLYYPECDPGDLSTLCSPLESHGASCNDCADKLQKQCCTDPYPVCSPRLQTSEPDQTRERPGCDEFDPICLLTLEADCADQPCTCLAMDFKMWSTPGWRDDCSQHLWSPSCDPLTGLYSPVQIKSDGEEEGQYRWCSSPLGEAIFGKEEEMLVTYDTTCKCSRKRWELSQNKNDEEGREDMTIHCDTIGNYETLQCDKGMCWCVESETGMAISIVVPEGIIEMLPCFNEIDLEVHYGDRYLRKCESRAIGVYNAIDLLGKHGTAWNLAGTSYSCDGDGSFAPLQRTSSRCQCVSDNNVQTGYAVEAGYDNACDSLGCRCARDSLESLAGDLQCQGNGNYATFQSRNDEQWCADPQDGWRLSNSVSQPSGEQCCIDYGVYTNPPDLDNPDKFLESDIGKFPFWDRRSEFSYGCVKYDIAVPGAQCNYLSDYCKDQTKTC